MRRVRTRDGGLDERAVLEATPFEGEGDVVWVRCRRGDLRTDCRRRTWGTAVATTGTTRLKSSAMKTGMTLSRVAVLARESIGFSPWLWPQCDPLASIDLLMNRPAPGASGRSL